MNYVSAMLLRVGRWRQALKKSCAPIPARERALSLLRLKSAALRTGLKGSGFARCCALRRFCGMRGTMRCGRRRGRNEPACGARPRGRGYPEPSTRITGIDDPKKLDANSREALAKEIKEKAASWSVAFVEVEEIDTINIYWAGILAMRRAVEGLGVVPQHLLIDAKRLKEIAIPQQAIIKGDAKSASIAAASILAKVSRDALMRTLDTRHPGSCFPDPKGYPVRAHYNALAQLGACPAHRRSFGPVREVLGLPPLPPWPLASERASPTLEPEA